MQIFSVYILIRSISCLTPNEIHCTVRFCILPLFFQLPHFLRFLGLVPLKVFMFVETSSSA